MQAHLKFYAADVPTQQLRIHAVSWVLSINGVDTALGIADAARLCTVQVASWKAHCRTCSSWLQLAWLPGMCIRASLLLSGATCASSRPDSRSAIQDVRCSPYRNSLKKSSSCRDCAGTGWKALVTSPIIDQVGSERPATIQQAPQ